MDTAPVRGAEARRALPAWRLLNQAPGAPDAVAATSSSDPDRGGPQCP